MILSTHIVSDVEATATDIALISGGTLVAHAAPEDLLRAAEGHVWEWVVPSAELIAAKQRYPISGTVRRADGVHVRLLTESPPAGAVPAAATLEDAYLSACLAAPGRGAGAMTVRPRALPHWPAPISWNASGAIASWLILAVPGTRLFSGLGEV